MNHIKFNFISDVNIHNNIIITLQSKTNEGHEFSRKDNFLKLNILEEKYNTLLDFEYLGGYIVENLFKYSGDFLLDLTKFEEDEAAFIINGIYLRSWCFDDFKTKKLIKIKELNIKLKNKEKTEKIFNEELKKTSDGVLWSRKITVMPPNIIYPETFVKEVEKLFINEKDVKITILDSKEIQKKNMNLLYGVGKGSKYPPYVLIIEKGDNPSMAFIGKGVTFDTGGTNLKGSEGMRHMKMDKVGAASVIGTVYASKEPIMGIVGLVENMIGPESQRMDDIIQAMSGDYVEIGHTDAEGRLVLADLNTLAQTYKNITTIINIASLTGAVKVCLGKEYAGLMSNNSQLVEKLKIAGNMTGDKVWELPCGPEYDYYLNHSTDADIINLGPQGQGGTIAGGKFLEYFIKDKSIKWAHIDIAAVHQKSTPLSDKNFSNGFGVRLINSFLKNNKCCTNKTQCCK